MNSLKYLMVLLAMLLFTICEAQIKNAKTTTVKIYGNCGNCKRTIEQAGGEKKVAAVDWNKDSKMATITYDESKTNQDEVLKRVALAGYDSDSFLAPDDAYAKLPDCCRYDRVKKEKMSKMEGHSMHGNTTAVPAKESTQETGPLNEVFDNYFSLKDALVKTDGNLTSAKAKDLLAAIKDVNMDKLSHEAHTVWMNLRKELTSDAGLIEKSKDVSEQRNYFASLSKNMYKLIKTSKPGTPLYYQHCPMKNANWLSKESAIKNPYYGSQMLSCGKTVETIK